MYLVVPSGTHENMILYQTQGLRHTHSFQTIKINLLFSSLGLCSKDINMKPIILINVITTFSLMILTSAARLSQAEAEAFCGDLGVMNTGGG
jgi:hypothetical protein